MSAYTVDRTAPTTYLDKSGKVVNGFQVTVTLSDFDEVHLINVPTLDKATVKVEADKLLKNRIALNDFSEE